MIKLFVFDVGGVLRDSSEALQESYKKAFESVGLDFPFKAEDTWHIRGLEKYNSSKKCLTALLAIYRSGSNLTAILNEKNPEEKIERLIEENISESDNDIIENLLKAYQETFYSQEISKMVKVYPDAKESLELLKSKGYYLAVFTNTKRNSIERDLSEFLTLFSLVICEEDVKNKKPSGEGIIKIYKELNISPKQTIYVGDAVSDISAARDAGCKSAAILTGMAKKEWLKSANFIFNNLKGLAEYFCK